MAKNVLTDKLSAPLDGARTAKVDVNVADGNLMIDRLNPSGIAARIHSSSGLGKIIVDPQFRQLDKYTYQAPDFDHAANKVEITVDSGAGNVSVNTK